MAYITIDLGTTNVKVGVYSDHLALLTLKSTQVTYERGSTDLVEFDPEVYFNNVIQVIKRCINDPHVVDAQESLRSIVLTGQAESLIVLDKRKIPLRSGISWQDTRSYAECEQLKAVFREESTYRITGQPAIIPTWPITKILWIKKHEQEVFDKARYFVLLKDYIAYRLTGELVGEFSIYNFTYYFDIGKKCYWKEILDYVGIDEDQLPKLVEPCTDIGRVSSEISSMIGIDGTTIVNIGTLDHFAGMIGTGNSTSGIVSESTGTVVSLATWISEPEFQGLPCHYGLHSDSYVLLPVCESGGASLQWYKDTFMKGFTFEEIGSIIEQTSIKDSLLFLPYVVGTNAPEFDLAMRGAFLGLQINHNEYDCYKTIMEGVCFLMKKNLMLFPDQRPAGRYLISTGGGAKSDIWSQMKADILGVDVVIPEQMEAACLGAAIIGAVNEGLFSSYKHAADSVVKFCKRYVPREEIHEHYTRKYEYFQTAYDSLLHVYRKHVN